VKDGSGIELIQVVQLSPSGVFMIIPFPPCDYPPPLDPISWWCTLALLIVQVLALCDIIWDTAHRIKKENSNPQE
jgi:hypothetical protein